MTLAEVVEAHIASTLTDLRGNMTQSAIVLGINRRTLYRKVRGSKWLLELVQQHRQNAREPNGK